MPQCGSIKESRSLSNSILSMCGLEVEERVRNGFAGSSYSLAGNPAILYCSQFPFW